MQPDNKLEFSDRSFDLFKRTIKTNVEAKRLRKANNVDLPEVLGIKLTNRCNLRCKHCYQWNESGYHQDMNKAEQNLDLDINLIEKLLEDTRSMQSRLYLWGGEPLVHREIGRIFELLEKDPRETTICTNAHFIGKHIDSICKVSDGLELLIALEGFEQQHDSMRGKDSFSRVVGAIGELVKLREEGRYKGKISVHSVINDGMIGRLYELMDLYESMGIDLVLLCFPWYIAEETSREMDEFIAEKFDWLIDAGEGRHTWDAFKYRISPLNIGSLMADLKRINARTWKTRVRYQPGLEFDEIEDFVTGKSMTARCATTCSVLTTRVDITPTGNVSACKFFSEFSVGNLHEQPISEIWQSDTYNKIRETLGKRLSPACSKCNTLYLQEHSIPMHI